MPRKNTQITRTCQHCGKEFRVSPSRLKPDQGGAQYCSKLCWGAVQRARATKVARVCQQCGKEFRVQPYIVRNGEGRYCGLTCLGIAQSWHTGYIRADGYRSIRVGGEDVLEHRHVMEEHLGRTLLPTEVVHHMNGKRTDNRLENLQVMSNSDHLRLHWRERRGEKDISPDADS